MYPAYKKNLQTKKGGDALLIVDPQVDFHTGSLGIPSAIDDSDRTAAFIRERESKLNEIYVTLDTHQRYHIAHAGFWTNAKNEHPTPFTEITPKDFDEGRWFPTVAMHKKWCKTYIDSLQKTGKTLTIWPDHCLVGTEGACVVKNIQDALADWERNTGGVVTYIRKGSNSLTEHYSAIRAEVERPDDPSTGLNEDLIRQLKMHDKIYVCGEALSHCVGLTLEDLAKEWDQAKLSQLVLLKDCTSSVVGFEKLGGQFLTKFSGMGLTIETTNILVGKPKRCLWF